MSLEQHIKKLVEAVKHQDEQHEADLRRYAELLSEKESLRNDLSRYRSERDQFRKLAEIFGMSQESTRSVHVEALDAGIEDTLEKAKACDASIDERKSYYSALRNSRHEELWRMDSENCKCASVYSYFGAKYSKVPEYVKNCLQSKDKLADTVLEYLVAKALIASEAKGSGEERKQLDEILHELLESCKKTPNAPLGQTEDGQPKQTQEPVQGDALWAEVHTILRLRQSERVLEKCEAALKAHTAKTEEFATFLAAHKETIKKLNTESGNLEKTVGRGENASKAADRVRDWYKEAKKDIKKAVSERERQQDKIDSAISCLEDIRKKLQEHADEGVTWQEAVEAAERIDKLQEELSSYRTVSELEHIQNNLLSEFPKQVGTVYTAVTQDSNIRQERARRKAVKKENKRQWRRNHPFLNFVRRVIKLAVIVLLPDILVHGWMYMQPAWEIEDGVISISGNRSQTLEEVYREDMLELVPAVYYWYTMGDEYLEEVKSFYSFPVIMQQLKETGGVLEVPEEVKGVVPESLYLDVSSYVYLEEVVLPESIARIEKVYSNTLSTVNMEYLESVEAYAFERYGGQVTPISELYVPKMKIVKKGAFRNNESLEVLVATSLQTIEDGAFAWCTSLKAAELPKVTKVGQQAFLGCESLTAVNIPSVEEIGDYAFADCSNLERINMLSVRNIGDFAFQGATSLKKIYLGGNLSEVGADAFAMEERQFEFILDSNSTYSQEVLEALGSYGVPILYEDFTQLEF